MQPTLTPRGPSDHRACCYLVHPSFSARGCQAEHRGGERLERRGEDADAAVQQLLVHGAGQEPAAAPAPAHPLPRPPLSRHLPAKFIRVRDAWRRKKDRSDKLKEE
jgi:hypothetical protein